MRALAPISGHEGLARAALLIALVAGLVLASKVDAGPPDYAVDLPYLREEVVALTGVETAGGHGGTAQPAYLVTHLESGDDVRLEAWWSDARVRTPAPFRVQGERRQDCILLLVSTTGPDLPTDRVATYLDRQATIVGEHLASLPHDPCAGRPATP